MPLPLPYGIGGRVLEIDEDQGPQPTPVPGALCDSRKPGTDRHDLMGGLSEALTAGWYMPIRGRLPPEASSEVFNAYHMKDTTREDGFPVADTSVAGRPGLAPHSCI